MSTHPLARIGQEGQSVWFDSISRGMLNSGWLKQLITDYSVVGVTSNPTIFEKAIAGSSDYDRAIEALSAEGLGVLAIYERLAADDIRAACDLLLPVYERTGHQDGRVSIEVNPHLATDTAATIAEARRLWQMVDRPNLMVKIPGTPESIPAVEQAITEGLSINVTLLFAVSLYEQVMEAYLRGLERRAAAGQPIDQIHSVASFFVSRVDTIIDKELEVKAAATTDTTLQARLLAMRGRAAIANAKVAYQAFLRVFSGPRWEALAAKGAQLQRPLWASTSTKNPAYPDTLYIAELIAPNSVNTIPENALLAFADHGEVRGPTITEDVAAADTLLAELALVGIDVAAITERRLVADGVKSFIASFDTLIAAIQQKCSVKQGA